MGEVLQLHVELPRDLMGTEDASQESARTFDERLTRCYELAGYALVLGRAGKEGGWTLVHGSIFRPGVSKERIGHAWLEHVDGRVWEPISAMIFPTRELWLAYAGAEEERRYSKKTASKRVVERGDWGRWHSSRYP